MPTLSAAIAEAYASATVGVVVLHTLELYHPTWAAPVRVVRDYADLSATLESDAPLNPGASVTFTACPFDFQLPQQGEGRQQLTVSLDNVGRALMPIVEGAELGHATPVRVTYRPYLSTDTSGPQMTPLSLDLVEIRSDIQRIQATCVYADWLSRKCPGRTYAVEDFPGVAPRG